MNSKYKYEMTKEAEAIKILAEAKTKEEAKYVWVNQCNAKVRKQTPVYSVFY